MLSSFSGKKIFSKCQPPKMANFWRTGQSSCIKLYSSVCTYLSKVRSLSVFFESLMNMEWFLCFFSHQYALFRIPLWCWRSLSAFQKGICVECISTVVFVDVITFTERKRWCGSPWWVFNDGSLLTRFSPSCRLNNIDPSLSSPFFR